MAWSRLVQWGLCVMLATASAACTHDFYGQIASGGASGTSTGSAATTHATTTGAQVSTGAVTSSTGVAPVQVTCGASVCMSPPQVCCQAANQPATGCKQLCGGGEITFACDGPEDCAAGECCYRAGVGASCAQKCTGSGVVVCHSNADCSGTTCNPSPAFAGFSMCG